MAESITDGIAEGVRKALLAGVGAAAFGAEKATELVDSLVKKGELTVDQGKDLNRELSQKVADTVSGAQDSVLRARLSAMTAEQRAAFIERARELASDLDAKDAAVAEAVPEETEAADEAAGPEIEDAQE